MKAARLDQNGVPVAFFTQEIHPGFLPDGSIDPAGPLADCVLISEQDWQAHINGSFRRYDIATATWVPYTPPPPPLADVKAGAKSAIDAAAGEARKRYITTSPGQEATYLLKERQAREYIAAGYPATPVPVLVQAEADALGVTPQQAADSIVTKADTWISLAATIERIRRGNNVAIDNATDAASVTSLRDSAITALAAV